MKGAGYYDQHSTAQLSSIHALQDWVEDAVANLPLPDSARPVTVLDLGSSEGRNAIHGMATIVEGLRRRTGQPVQTMYGIVDRAFSITMHNPGHDLEWMLG